MVKKKDYLMTAVGNPDGDDKPNKKFFDVSACAGTDGALSRQLYLS